MREPKKGFAIEFINRIRTMEPAELNALIVREAGEELAQFFLTYSREPHLARPRARPREHLEPHAHGLSHPRRRGPRPSGRGRSRRDALA